MVYLSNENQGEVDIFLCKFHEGHNRDSSELIWHSSLLSCPLQLEEFQIPFMHGAKQTFPNDLTRYIDHQTTWPVYREFRFYLETQ